MMGRIFASTAVALALALGALPARAEHGRFDEHRRFADIHARDVALAGALRHATAELYREAVARAGRVDRRESRALESLRRLDRQAGELRAQVARHGLYDRRSGRELGELRRDLARAEGQLPALAHSRALRRDLARVHELAGRLDARLAAAGGSRGGDDRYARALGPRGRAIFGRR
jgi:hypothetical protein